MIKKWNQFIREFVENSDNIIEIKMVELKELIDSVGDGHNLLYEWKNKDNHEVIINFNWDSLSIRYEFNVDNMSIVKVVNEQIDFQESVDSIDEALDIIEKDIHNIIGVSESKLLLESVSENLLGFKRKLLEILDSDDTDSVLKLMPEGVIMPIFYKSDKAELKSGELVTIVEVGYKNREYIYYYELDNDVVYSYESDFEF